MGAERSITLPDLGDFKEIEVVEILVKPGDAVAAEQSILVLESDKATMELPAPFGGRVAKIAVQVRDKVGKGAVLMILEGEGEAPHPASAHPLPGGEGLLPPGEGARRADEGVVAKAPVAAPIEEIRARGTAGKAHASPSVRRLSRELGVDLSHVPGTGPHNRILREDVQRYVKHVMAAAGTATGEGFAFPGFEPAKIDFSQYGPIKSQPLTKIQKVAGRNLLRAWVTVPHVTQHGEADITDLESFRKEMIAKPTGSGGAKLTLLSFFMKAVCVVLKEQPKFNSSLDPKGENLILKDYFHVGVAVDTPNGLVVPVIRDVHQKSLTDLAQELRVVSDRARARRLSPQDLQGGCFTISSLGGIGGSYFTPIINPPEVAVLGVSKAATKSVFKDKAFVPRLMVPLSLSYDHRVIDGADGARFIVRLQEVLQDVRNMLL